FARNVCWSAGFAEDVSDPARPPTPLKTNFWFQLAGSITSKFAEPGSAPSPEVATEPFTSQYSGFGADAGMAVADTIVILGMPRALRAAEVQSVANTGTLANAAQSNAASPIRKTKK